ncbi:hypothetical protein D3C80_1831540 [compost metagenome]
MPNLVAELASLDGSGKLCLILDVYTVSGGRNDQTEEVGAAGAPGNDRTGTHGAAGVVDD